MNARGSGPFPLGLCRKFGVLGVAAAAARSLTVAAGEDLRHFEVFVDLKAFALEQL